MLKKISLLSVMFLVVFLSSCNREKLTIYEVDYTDVGMTFGELPSTSNKNVLLTCSAAFTATLKTEFSYNNINGVVINKGKRYNGVMKKYGMFAFINKKAYFTEYPSTKLIRKAVANKGTLFQQLPIIINGKTCKLRQKRNARHQYRALCERNNRLFVAEASYRMQYKDFVQALEKQKVDNAIYLDVGYGWDRAWYRDKNGNVKWIFKSHRSDYPTNYITFYK